MMARSKRTDDSDSGIPQESTSSPKPQDALTLHSLKDPSQDPRRLNPDGLTGLSEAETRRAVVSVNPGAEAAR